MVDKLDLAAKALRWSGGGVVLRALPSWQGVLVLNYHRIGDPFATDLDRDLFSARQEQFDDQIGFLKQNYDIILPTDLPTAVTERRGRHVMITFDDGYRDNYDLALPILRKHGVAATFFICTGFIDQPRLPWWDAIAWMVRTSTRNEILAGKWFPAAIPLGADDRTPAIRQVLQRFKQLPSEQTETFLEFLKTSTERDPDQADATGLWMGWQMIRDLHQAGMMIGAHTVRHHLLARLPVEEQEIEIRESRDRITSEIGTAPKVFAYPVGSTSAFTEETKELLQRYGFEAAFSFYGGMQPYSPFDRFDIRRAHVGHVATQTIYQAMTTLPTLFARW